MSYRLREKPLVREVRRVAREELEGTLKELLTVNDQARSTAVHEARKHLKKVRRENCHYLKQFDIIQEKNSTD
jgi:hypothetical protein